MISRLDKLIEKTGIIWGENINEESDIKLKWWRVYCVDNYLFKVYFIGYYGHSIISSSILKYDPISRKALSNSGEIFELVGKEPSYNQDVIIEFDRWLGIHGAPDIEDVSLLFLTTQK